MRYPMYLQHGMNTIDSTKLIELAKADYKMLKDKGKEGEEVLHYNGFLDGFARGLHEGSTPWHKVSEELPKDRRFIAYNPITLCYDTILWNRINGGFDCLNNPSPASIKESHFEDYYDYWMEIPEIEED